MSDDNKVDDVKRINDMMKDMIRDTVQEIHPFDLVTGIAFTLGEVLSCINDPADVQLEVMRINHIMRKGLAAALAGQRADGLRPTDETVTQ